VSAVVARATPPVPLVLVRLKVRLVRNGLRTAGGAVRAALSALAAFVLGVGGFTAAALSAHADDPRASRAVLVLGAAAIVVCWALFPLLAFGTDETLDPQRLQLLPLARRPLMTGLLAASLVGFAPVGVAVALVGVEVGATSVAAVLLTPPALALLLLLAAATGRTLSTLLAASITSRRGRDVMVAVVSFLALAVQAIRFVDFSGFDAADADRASDVVRWTPPGALGQAVLDARDGRVVASVLGLVPAMVAIPLLLLAWGWALDRSLTRVPGGAAVRTARHARTGLHLLPRWLPALPPTPWGAVAAKELRCMARDPTRRLMVAQTVLFGVGGAVWFSVSSGARSPGVVLLGSLAGYLVLLGSMNQFGFDGAAYWLDVVAGNQLRAELVGKNVATLVQALPVVALGSVLLAAWSGGWAYVPASLVLAGAGIGAGLGVANVASVRFPQRVRDRRNPFGASQGGQGCVTGLMLLLAMIVQGLLLAPVGIAAGLCAAFAPAALVVVAPACAVYGGALWWAGVVVALRWAWWRQAEILAAITPV
jgi:ABC-2 type transport system permease protein